MGNRPLGLASDCAASGNGVMLIVKDEVLAGGGPSDVRELTLAVATEMLACAGLDADPAQVLDSGKAMDAWKTMIRAQGGDPDAPLPLARHTEVITAAADGYLTKLDAMAVGLAAWRLGAGRAKQGDPVQAAAGVTWHAGVGDRVTAGQPLFTLHTDTPERFERAVQAIADAAEIGADPVLPGPIVLERIS